jgi:exopolysaccharide biosynthesis WecB/TagA/CpsF family protein
VAAEFTLSAPEPQTARTRDILGIAVADLTEAGALATLHRAISSRRHVKLAFCNAHTANTAWSDGRFRAALAGFLVLPDGVGVDIAARQFGGRPFQANLNGTDFVPRLVSESPTPLRIALVGGRPGVAERAAAELARLDGRHRFAPALHGYADQTAVDAWLRDLAAEPADIILVAMGNPRQELWIADNITAQHGVLAIGVGALFDFLAGETPRAPAVLRRMRLEWLYRLALEPRRLFRRYVLGNPMFLARVLALKLGLAKR